MTRLLLACIAAALLLSSLVPLMAQTPAASAQAPTGNAENGQQLYTAKSCFYCHGTEGQGGRPYPRIARVQRSQDNFIRYVRGPARMAAYSETVASDAELADIYAFLRSLPAPTPVQEIPLLEQMRKPSRK